MAKLAYERHEFSRLRQSNMSERERIKRCVGTFRY
jgi:hypothetical protein